MSNKTACKTCVQCDKEFEYKIPDCCSFTCGNRLKAKNNRFWAVASEEQKIERMRLYFEKYVIKNEDPDKCWGWSGMKTPSGYGILHCSNLRRAHRLSWIIHNGPFPKELHVLHKCDMRSCTNPNHLFLGTHQDNMNDMLKKGRVDLTEEQVIRIIADIKGGDKGIVNIAKEYGISVTTVTRIKQNKSWKYIDRDVSTVPRKSTKLNRSSIKEIKLLLKENVTSKEIAKKYNVSYTTINDIKQSRRYANIE